MTKMLSHFVVASALAAATLTAASPASAQTAGCNYRAGPFGFMARERPALCPYQGDYMVQQRASYDGPARIAPQPTYAPSRTINQVYPAVALPVAVETDMRGAPRAREVNVQNELPPGKGRPKVVRANAEVRIYGPERMDIRLYRR